jgi:hypothetical protein
MAGHSILFSALTPQRKSLLRGASLKRPVNFVVGARFALAGG